MTTTDRVQGRGRITMDLETARAAWPKRVHCLGIGGAGVSGVARILTSQGVRISGHDKNGSVSSEALTELGLEIATGTSVGT